MQYSGSVTFWYGSGFQLFLSDTFKTPTKKIVFFCFFYNYVCPRPHIPFLPDLILSVNLFCFLKYIYIILQR